MFNSINSKGINAHINITIISEESTSTIVSTSEDDSLISVTSYQAYLVSFVTNAPTSLAPIETSLLNFPPSITNDPLVLEGWYFGANFTSVVNFPYRVTAPITIYAKWIEGTPGFNFQINSKSNGYIVTSYGGNASQVAVPASYQGLPVVEVGRELFYENGSITLVSLPSTITAIRFAAFKNATALTSIVLPNSLTTIDGDAFSGALNLSSVTFSSSLTYIGTNAFENTKLAKITLPSVINEIGARAFADIPTLTEVVINSGNPPLIYPSSFENASSNLVFKVPTAAVNSYKTNENWQAFANQIVGF